jgi:hypothetical protein
MNHQNQIQSKIPGWLNKNETSELLGLKTTSLWKLRQEGKVKWSKLGRNIYFNIDSILQLIEENSSK